MEWNEKNLIMAGKGNMRIVQDLIKKNKDEDKEEHGIICQEGNMFCIVESY